jgi:serralysin
MDVSLPATMPFGSPVPTSTVGATFNNNIDGLLSGVKWRDYTASAPISYSFTDNINDYESTYANRASHAASFQTLNATQRTAARAWITQYANVSNANFVELTGASDRNATIRMASSNVPSTAFAYYPNNSLVEGGDAWFNKSTGSYTNPILGTYAYHTFGHELGHALGLKHGQELGGVRNVALNPDRDSMEFSIMTYRSYIGGPVTGYTNESGGYAQTLMMYDIAAIQQMYGADFTTNATNTTYTFSTTTGEMFINGVGQGVPYSNRIFRTIWDGDGVDTYDFSNYTTSLSIDLTPGGWVDLDRFGNFQRANLGGGTGGGLHSGHARAHIYNALQFGGDGRSLIENAIGGTGNDVLIGNTANNILNGGAGADNMAGGLGNDTYIVDNIGDVVTEAAASGIDTVQSSVTYTLTANVENLILTGAVAINGTGNGDNNSITGNSADNTLNGGAGADNMAGGLGNDIYIVDNISDVVTEAAASGIDTVQSSVTYTLTANVENLTLTGAVAINGTGNVDNNSITGNSASNTINGRAGADSLTGLGGADIFVFQFGQSISTAFDRITDFTINTDKIDLLTSGGLAMAPPVAFSRAANNISTNLATLISNVFSDANGALAGNQALGLNSAALVVATASAIAGTYLIINDATNGFQSTTDLLINLTGYSGSLPGLGSITPSTWFA